MPIPFLLVGLGVVTGVVGSDIHSSAEETNDKAQKILQDAQNIYNSAKCSLEQAQNKTEKALLQLGYEKKNTLDSSMQQFLNSYDKIKHIQVTKSIGINEIERFSIEQEDAIELKQLTDIYSSSITSGVTGAAAGAVVALAASGSLPIVTGGLATAASSFIAGEAATAAGIAGSALSAGAAMIPLASIAGPVILFTGISASMKADENLEKANTMYAEAEAASEKMKVSETLCNGISDRSAMFYELLVNLNEMFSECSELLAGVVKKKEGILFKKKLTSADFSEEDLKLIAVTRALAGAVKSVIDTPILSKDGSVSDESYDTYDQTIKGLPNLQHAFEDVKQINYNVKPIKAKVASSSSNSSGSFTSKSTVWGKARNILAILLGGALATIYAQKLAIIITNGQYKLLFIDSFTANKIALWIIICASVMMIIGRFSKSIIGKGCEICSGIGLLILYVQYCRTVELMNHSIIFSIISFIAIGIIAGFLEGKKEKWACGLYLYNMMMRFCCIPFLFLIYSFFSQFIGISSGICLVVSSVIMCLISLGVTD